MSTPTLRIQSWRGIWGESLLHEVLQPFEAVTGIATERVFHVGLHLPESLTDSLDQRRPPPVDVVWCNTPQALRAARRGWATPLLSKIPSTVLYDLAHMNTNHPDDRNIAQVYAVHYVLLYHRSYFPLTPPSSWNVLFKPEFAGRLVLYPEGNGIFPVAQVLGGGAIRDIPLRMAPCWSIVQRLASQLGLSNYSIGLEKRLSDRAIALCYRALPNALAFQSKGLDVGWVIPDEGIADTTDALWIPRGLDQKRTAQARRLIAFALSADIQSRWCATLGTLPMHRDAAIPPLFALHPRLPCNADDNTGILNVSEVTKAIWEPTWARKFDYLTMPILKRNATNL